VDSKHAIASAARQCKELDGARLSMRRASAVHPACPDSQLFTFYVRCEANTEGAAVRLSPILAFKSKYGAEALIGRTTAIRHHDLLLSRAIHSKRYDSDRRPTPARIRTIAESIPLVTPRECVNYFKAADHEPT